MIHLIRLVLASCLFSFSGPVFAQDTPAKAPTAECASCAKGAAGETVWCEGCKAGYHDGTKIKCQRCYEGATGKAVWCADCAAGYVDGEKIACQKCYNHKADASGPCDEHSGEEG
jgi:hypothetical protein